MGRGREARRNRGPRSAVHRCALHRVRDTRLRRQRHRLHQRWFRQGQFNVRIDKTFPLEAVVEAHRYLEKAGHIGKVVAGGLISRRT
jgi:NADPH:quinone reductase-like Zn-dependent oxidoreductase